MSSEAKVQEPDLLDLIEGVKREPDKRLRVLELHRLAFQLHKERIEKGGGKGIQYLDATHLLARLRFTVGFEGTPLWEPQVDKVLSLVAEAVVEGNFDWACSGIDILLKNDTILRNG